MELGDDSEADGVDGVCNCTFCPPKPLDMESTIKRYLLSSIWENENNSTKKHIISAMRSAKVAIHAGAPELCGLALGISLTLPRAAPQH